jgi:hypothetical protein
MYLGFVQERCEKETPLSCTWNIELTSSLILGESATSRLRQPVLFGSTNMQVITQSPLRWINIPIRYELSCKQENAFKISSEVWKRNMNSFSKCYVAGIIWSNGKKWKTMQSLLKTAMEDTNVVSALRRHLTEEFEEFQSHVRDGSTTYNLEYLIRHAAFNFLSAFLIGKRYWLCNNGFTIFDFLLIYS